MTERHQKQMSSKLVSTTVTLIDYLVNKSSQARKIVQWSFIEPILREGRSLFVNITDMLDGVECSSKALRNVYNIQKQSILVCYLEKNKIPKVVDGKKKKHYGFDVNACAYIDECCDDIISQISSYGQSHESQNKG